MSQEARELVEKFKPYMTRLGNFERDEYHINSIDERAAYCAILSCKLRLDALPDTTGLHEELEGWIIAEKQHYTQLITLIKNL